MRAARRRPGHPGAAGPEEALGVAERGEDQDGGEEADDGAETGQFVGRVIGGDGADGDHEDGRGHGDDRLAPAPGPEDGAEEDGGQEDGGDRFGERGVQGTAAFPGR